MSTENKSIHEFDFGLICEYFSGIERQGPGSSEATIKATGFIDNLSESSVTADIGCGTGGQTMVLAQHIPGAIIGIDLFQEFIDILNENAQKKGLSERVKGFQGSMEELPFEDGGLDLIWSEGAIYNIGFKKGLEDWNRFLKKNGYIAVTEVSWLTDDRPMEIEEFWTNAYPEIDTIAHKTEIMQQAGYTPMAIFVLPENCWTENYYEPQKEAQRIFLEKYPDNNTASELIANQRHEADMYARYKDFFGYVFYIGKKR